MSDAAQQAVERGIQAKALLENSLFREVMDTLDGHYHAAWRESETIEKREDCFRYVKLIEKLFSDIKTLALTGELTQKRLDEISGTDRRSGIAKLVSNWAA